MRAFLTEIQSPNRTSILTVVRAIELVFFSAATIYYIMMFKGAMVVSFTSSSCDFVLMSVRKPVSIFKGLLSSTLQICFFMNFIVLLIVVSSFSHHPQKENSDNEDGDAEKYIVHEDVDNFHNTSSPSLCPPAAPPPMKTEQEKAKMKTTATKGDSTRGEITSSAPTLRKQQDTVEVTYGDFHSTLLPSLCPPAAPPPTTNDQEKAKYTAAAATAARLKTTATKAESTGGNIASSASTLRKKKDTVDQVTYGDKTASEVHQKPVFFYFSRLANAKDIKKEQTIVDGSKIRTAENLKRVTNVTQVTEHHFFKAAAFADLPKLAEAKEIKKAFQNPQDTNTKHGQIRRKETQNQAKKQLENEDHCGEDDSMEATWRVINGATKPQEKQLKKCETWPQQPKFVIPDDEYSNQMNINMAKELPESSSSVGSSPVKELKKSLTFNDIVTIQRRGGLIRKDPSMTLEEFNQKVDAFIKNFNHEMRLQRQESDQRYLDMINRGL